MEKTRFEYPEEYKYKLTSYFEVAYGPGFCAFGKRKFEKPMTVEEMIVILEADYHWPDKGVSIYLHEEKKFLIFLYRKFVRVSEASPKASLVIDGIEVSPVEITPEIESD